MTNLIRSNFQAHPFHLVSPSPWPLYTSISLLILTTTGVLTMHGFISAKYFLFLALLTLIFSMSFWFRDVISEGKQSLSNYYTTKSSKINKEEIECLLSKNINNLNIQDE